MKPEISQELLEQSAAFSEALTTVQAHVRTLERSGAKPAPGPWVLNREMLNVPIPAIAFNATADALDPCSPAWASRMRELISGGDLAVLESRGMYAAAKAQRRVNLAAYRTMLDAFGTRAAQAFAARRSDVRERNDWGEAEEILCGAATMKWNVLLLRAAAVLYAVHFPHAVRLAGRALDALTPILAALRPTAEVIEFPVRA